MTKRILLSASLLLAAGLLGGGCSFENHATEPIESRDLPPFSFDSLLVAEDWFPAWSPDGSLVAYSHTAFTPEGGRNGIYYVKVRGDSAGVPHLVAHVPSGLQRELSVASDNRRVAYWSGGDIWVADLYSQQVQRVTTNHNALDPS